MGLSQIALRPDSEMILNRAKTYPGKWAPKGLLNGLKMAHFRVTIFEAKIDYKPTGGYLIEQGRLIPRHKWAPKMTPKTGFFVNTHLDPGIESRFNIVTWTIPSNNREP